VTKTRLIRLGVVAAVVVVAVVLWRVLDGGSDRPAGPEAISKVAGWLDESGECPEGIDFEVSKIPVGPHGPPGTFFQLFGRLPEAGALTACTNTLGGFVGWFRFPSAKAMEGALRRHPEIAEAELTCTRGSELLIDSILGNDKFVPEDCRRLGFKVHPAVVEQ
jgi:hypothetical protein